MNDRDKIITAIKSEYVPGFTLAYGAMADAVLAAIGDRLLPELPTVIGDYRIVGDYQITPNNDETWSVMVWDDADDLIVDGTASTPALAIRAALEADQ